MARGRRRKIWPRRSYEIQRAASAKAGTKCKTTGAVLRGIGEPVRGVFLKQVGHHGLFPPGGDTCCKSRVNLRSTSSEDTQVNLDNG